MKNAATEPRRSRQRGVLLATVGWTLALAGLLLVREFDLTRMTLGQWELALGVTVAVQAMLWLILQRGWDRKLASFDPQFIYVPMLASAGLISTYVYLAPEARTTLLMVWFVALMFVTGSAGFAEVFILSVAMAAGYMIAMAFLYEHGLPLRPAREWSVAAAFLAVAAYGGVIFERLRNERLEMREMRHQLSQQAITDPLTLLPNRRHFEDRLRIEMARISRYGGCCTLALLDVDFFKIYNDSFGHAAGDQLLRELGQLIRHHLRDADILARYGGEEFCILMVNAPKQEAYRALDRLREIISEHAFAGEYGPMGHRLTISAGVASCPQDGIDEAVLLRKADDALYAAKREGRNRVYAAV